MLRMSPIATVALLCAQTAAWSTPSLVRQVSDGVYMVYDDTGDWGGVTTGRTHQNSARYQAKKVLDLSDLPEDVWQATRAVRLSLYTGVLDYSFHDNPPADGLDEAFEVVINGQVHRFATDCGIPPYVHSATPTMAWYEMAFPKAEFVRGANEIILRKAPDDENDDYLYIGIATGPSRGNSMVPFDGEPWTSDRLTMPGGSGEYMIRLHLVTTDLSTGFTWRPGAEQPLDDPDGLALYAGARDVGATPDGLPVPEGTEARVEWEHRAIDRLEPLTLTVEATAPFELAWLAEGEQPHDAVLVPGLHTAVLAGPLGASQPRGISIAPGGQGLVLRSVRVAATRDFRPVPQAIDMCPVIAPPAGQAADRPPACRIDSGMVVLENAHLRCRFRPGERLRLVSLFNEHAAAEMLGDEPALFVVEADGKRYAGSRDFRLGSVRPRADGFEAELLLDRPPLRATLGAAIDDEGLRLSLSVMNDGAEAVGLKVAFPHLAGLRVSDASDGDYYFYPWGGGIIADRPAHIRAGYGDHAAYYQVMDVLSPVRGAGLSLRIDAAEGRHKILALRKHLPDTAEIDADVVRRDIVTREEHYPIDSLEPVPGTSLACEYMLRTRQPGESFSPPDAVVSAHAGDWHEPMRRYAHWAHRTWRFRPYPSRMTPVVNWMSVGTRLHDSVVFRDGAYRSDLVNPKVDALEL